MEIRHRHRPALRSARTASPTPRPRTATGSWVRIPAGTDDNFSQLAKARAAVASRDRRTRIAHFDTPGTSRSRSPCRKHLSPRSRAKFRRWPRQPGQRGRSRQSPVVASITPVTAPARSAFSRARHGPSRTACPWARRARGRHRLPCASPTPWCCCARARSRRRSITR